jgi:hypothetical protein
LRGDAHPVESGGGAPDAAEGHGALYLLRVPVAAGATGIGKLDQGVVVEVVFEDVRQFELERESGIPGNPHRRVSPAALTLARGCRLPPSPKEGARQQVLDLLEFECRPTFVAGL